MSELRLLTFPEIVVHWTKIRPLLSSAIAKGRGEIEVDDVLDLAGQGRMSISVVWRDGSIALSIAAEVIHYPRRKVLNLAFAGGKDAKFVSDRFDEYLGEMARSLGADAVQCYCAPAVARLLKKMQPSAEEAYIVLERKVAA